MPALPWLAGLIVDLPTPFHDDDSVDLAAFAQLCERQIAAGASALLVGETAGEMATLTDDEHDALVRTAVAIARGRACVIAGAGSNATGHAIALTRRAEAAGADAAMSVVPYYNKPTQAGFEAHFRAVADATTLPVILHDAPSRCARGLADDALLRLAATPRIVGLLDRSGDPMRPLRLRAQAPGFALLTGDDSGAVSGLMPGCDGWVSSLAAVVPERCVEAFEACHQGRPHHAARLAALLLPLAIALTADTTPASVKYALGLHGWCSPRVRLPMVELSATEKAAIALAMTASFKSGASAA
jgi:4-hydroxy-tetrahydrodipicolinate synthase